MRGVPELKKSQSTNRAPLAEVAKPSASESKPAKGEIEKTTPQQQRSTVIATTNDPAVAEVAPVKPASGDANAASKSGGGRVAQRMKELSRFAEQQPQQQQPTVTQQHETQVQQSTSETNVRNATTQPTTVTAAKEKERVEATSADVWVTRGQPISTETIEGFTKKLSGTAFLFSFSPTSDPNF